MFEKYNKRRSDPDFCAGEEELRILVVGFYGDGWGMKKILPLRCRAWSTTRIAPNPGPQTECSSPATASALVRVPPPSPTGDDFLKSDGDLSTSASASILASH